MSGLSRRSKEDQFNYVPAGTVLSFAGATAPSGWALCDGTMVNRLDYASLYLAIGNAWGSGNGSTTFHLPDLRGKFLRGTDNAAGADPDAGTRTASNAGGNTGDNVGSSQGNATKKNGLAINTYTASHTSGTQSANHNHYLTTNFNPSGNSNGTSYASSYGNTPYNPTYYQNMLTGANNQSHSHSTNITHNHSMGNGDLETRPVNANMNYIIKL